MKRKPNVELKNHTLNLLIILAVTNLRQIRCKSVANLWKNRKSSEKQPLNHALFIKNG